MELKTFSNPEIAKVFYEIAEMMSILGEDPFRTRAYDMAARSIEFAGEDLADIYQRGGVKALDELEGVGSSIAEKIEELLKTGKVKTHEELRQKVPQAELTFTEIPGVGPKMAAKLYQTFKVPSLTGLKKALKARAALKHFGQKTIANILRGIEILKSQEGRMLLPEAHAIAQDFLAGLKKCPGVIRTDPVGSLRRFQETVGDVDLVAASKSTKKTIECFIKLPAVKEVVEHGSTKATVIVADSRQIDLEIVPEAQYGSLLQHFTGSKDHNIALRTFAVKHGLSISEHGVKSLKTKKTVPCRTEEQLYKLLGLDYIAPELRENRGEIEAALAKELPKLVELEDLKGDLQVHSDFSDGRATVLEMAQAAQNLGYEYLAITDHSPGLGIARGLSEERLKEQWRQIEAAQERLKIRIFKGTEVNIKADGSLDYPDEVLEKFDLVVASIHSSFKQEQKVATERVLKALESPHVDIFGHPSGRLRGVRPEIDLDWERIFKAAKKNNVALEIDGFPDRLDLKDTLVKEAKRFGCLFTCDTDSHHPSHLANMVYAVANARRGWLEKKDVLNTRDLKEFENWLESRRG